MQKLFIAYISLIFSSLSLFCFDNTIESQDHNNSLNGIKGNNLIELCSKNMMLCGPFAKTRLMEKNYSEAKELLEIGCNSALSKDKNKNYLDNCNERGILYMNDQDYTKAYELFNYGCSNGYLKSCTNKGIMTLQGKGIDQNITKGIQELGQVCAKNEMKSCLNLGIFYIQGNYIKQDISEGIKMLHKACINKETSACLEIGYIYLIGTLTSGEKTHISQDQSLATKYYEQGCNAGDIRACLFFAMVLQSDTNPKKDVNKAFEILQNGCNKNFAPMCWQLSLSYKNGIGVEKNLEKYKELMKKACDLNFSRACSVYKSAQ